MNCKRFVVGCVACTVALSCMFGCTKATVKEPETTTAATTAAPATTKQYLSSSQYAIAHQDVKSAAIYLDGKKTVATEKNKMFAIAAMNDSMRRDGFAESKTKGSADFEKSFATKGKCYIVKYSAKKKIAFEFLKGEITYDKILLVLEGDDAGTYFFVNGKDYVASVKAVAPEGTEKNLEATILGIFSK